MHSALLLLLFITAITQFLFRMSLPEVTLCCCGTLKYHNKTYPIPLLCLFLCLSLCLSLSLSVSVSLCLSVSVCLSVCLSVSYSISRRELVVRQVCD